MRTRRPFDAEWLRRGAGEGSIHEPFAEARRELFGIASEPAPLVATRREGGGNRRGRELNRVAGAVWPGTRSVADGQTLRRFCWLGRGMHLRVGGIADVNVVAATSRGTGRQQRAANHEGHFGRQGHPVFREVRHNRQYGGERTLGSQNPTPGRRGLQEETVVAGRIWVRPNALVSLRSPRG